MRAYEFRGKSLDTLKIVDRPTPRPGEGQVLVRMRAASLNYRDYLVGVGRYRLSDVPYPLVPLSDGAGEVVEVGPGASRLKVGDRVAGNFFQKWIDGPFGSVAAASALGGAIEGVLAEEVVLEEAAAVKFPPALSFEEGATLPCAGVTAWMGLVVLGAMKAGETVLAMGTGGVSVLALQLAKGLGGRVIVTSSSDEKLERARGLGADGVINYKTTRAWGDAARALTDGRGVDHILEVGGAATLPTSLRALRDGGHLTLVGLLCGVPAERETAAKNGRGIRVDSVYVGSVRHFEQMNEAIAKMGMHPVVDRVFPFEEARAAYDYLHSGQHFGKIVIRV